MFIFSVAPINADQCGEHLCCKVKNGCDVCNGHKDKPQRLVLRWVGTSKKTITFSSDTLCVRETRLTSNSDSDEVVLDAASCFGYGNQLPTDLYFKVDGSSGYLHASCSQPLNLGDVIFQDENKGFLILVGFRAMSGRTDGQCSSAFNIKNNQCDVCNRRKDKPQKLTLRWVGG